MTKLTNKRCLRDYCNKELGFALSKKSYEVYEELARELVEKAAMRAKENSRSTILDRDF